jgi:hypothetical protein
MSKLIAWRMFPGNDPVTKALVRDKLIKRPAQKLYLLLKNKDGAKSCKTLVMKP